jgi:rare lipoprotein A (peptidoglycan hydrolase)
MRRLIAQGLTMAFVVSLGAAQGPNRSGSNRHAVALLAKSNIALSASRTRSSSRPYEVGTASWYGEDFEGKPTASGEPFNMYDFTAAHPTLPLGTFVKVTNLRNRRAVVVRINDRGPVVPGRIIDVSYGAAKTLKFHSKGIQRVRLDIVPPTKVPAMIARLDQPHLMP